MQYQAGYILDGILELFEEDIVQKEQTIKLAQWLCMFELEGLQDANITFNKTSPLLSMLTNLMVRGRPTRLNIKALQLIASKTKHFELNTNELGITIKWGEEIRKNLELINQCFHIIDPRITSLEIKEGYGVTGYKLGSEYEETFLFNTFKHSFGQSGDGMIQLLASQRLLSNILRNNLPDNLPQHVRRNFEEQRTDFSIEFPYTHDNKPHGVVVEIDGGQHHNHDQNYLDRQRDETLTKINWHNTIRIPTENIRNERYLQIINTVFRNAVNNTYITKTLDNYTNSLLLDPFNKDVLQFVLIPFGIARIQRTIIELIRNNKLSPEASKWKIAVIERDVPCAAIAINDFEELMQQLNILSPEINKFPEIQFEVYCTKEFIDSSFQLAQNLHRIEDFRGSDSYDCVIDISVLQRNGVIFPIKSSAPVVSIRSVHFVAIDRKISTANHINYFPVCERTIDERWNVFEDKEKALAYLLQCIFRKSRFRPGQLPIINKALQGKSVIGLLPTGGGKSITYQLAALLQPGICMVIDPIRSLMKDQVDGLNENYIDSAVFINSTLKGEDKAKAFKKMISGQALFVFVSPERLQMDDFREMLGKMFDDKLYFSYCVIDEAHCVSEWGHDFRTSYLRLGINANKSCKTASGIPVPLFALTATASYDVLADIQRELSGYGAYKLDDDSLIRFESSIRPEIQFIIEDVTVPAKVYNDIWALKRALGEAKRNRINQVFDNLPETFKDYIDNPDKLFSKNEWEENPQLTSILANDILIKDFNTNNFYSDKNGGLIFCPHKSGFYGITDQFKPQREGRPVQFEGIFDHIRNRPSIQAGFFMGSGDEQDEASQVILERSIENQDLFKKNKLNLMIATKAFGMGIDKPNIRYTVHMNYPGSIESFVQETGRAGRDRGLAFSFLLLNRQSFSVGSNAEELDHDQDINFYFHNNSFKGVNKEMAVLDELLTEIYFPDRTAEIENLVHLQLDVEVNCKYWERGANKRLYINQGFNQLIGFVDLINLAGNINGTINIDLSNKIIPLVISYIRDLQLTVPAWEWIQLSDKEAGIEQILASKKEGEEFTVEVGFINNHKERVKTLTNWLQTVVHQNFKEDIVQKIRRESNNADIFIEKVEEIFNSFTGGEKLDFEEVCRLRDNARRQNKGYTFGRFSNLFNGYRNKQDTERAIYRLSLLGVIDDYTVNFNSQTFKLHGIKKSDKAYKKRVEDYLHKFYSEKTARKEIKRIADSSEPSYLRQCLHFIVTFVYASIKEKRALAIKEMKDACIQSIEKGEEGNLFLREYIDLYFNSKYARKGYFFLDEETGKEVPASLTDSTNDGIESDLKIVWKFIEYVENDKSGTPIENTKHLRGACIRMITNFPENYTFRLLNAFTLFILEFKNKRLMEEAIENLIVGFNLITSIENANDKELEKIFDKYQKVIYEKNDLLELKLLEYEIDFSFETIMISRVLKTLVTINKSFQSLNKILG